jgi:hypothetical protein
VLAASISRSLIALIMEAASTSEISVNFYETRRLSSPKTAILLTPVPATHLVLLDRIDKIVDAVYG